MFVSASIRGTILGTAVATEGTAAAPTRGVGQHLVQLQTAILDRVDLYCSQRKQLWEGKDGGPYPAAGEYLDRDSAKEQQYGVAGTGMLLEICRLYRPNTSLYNDLRTLLQTATPDSDARVKKLREAEREVPSKALISLLFPDGAEKHGETVNWLFAADGRVRAACGVENQFEDVLMTAYTLHVLRWRPEEVRHSARIPIGSALAFLRKALEERQWTSFQRLLISSSIAVHDRTECGNLRKALFEILSKNYHLSDAVFDDGLFTEINYVDGARTRYIKIPKFYLILISIYVIAPEVSTFQQQPFVKVMVSRFQSEIEKSRPLRALSASYNYYFSLIALDAPNHYIPEESKPIWFWYRHLDLRVLSYWHAMTFIGRLLVLAFIVMLAIGSWLITGSGWNAAAWGGIILGATVSLFTVLTRVWKA